MKLVVITGCLGFIGSHVANKCLGMGWKVYGIDSETYAANPQLIKTFKSNYKKQFTFINEGKRVCSKSFKIGTVRFINNLVDDRVWDAIRNWIIKNARPYRKITLMGSGGNINKLFKLSNIREGKPLSIIKLNQIFLELDSLSYEERIVKFQLNPDRADVIIPAARIYLKALEWSGGQKIYVPRFGLSDGMIKYMYNNKPKKI